MRVQCPKCPAKISVSPSAETATCPKCRYSFAPEFEESSLPSWVSGYGLAGTVCATAAVFSASLLGNRLLTIALASAGLLVVVGGVVALGGSRELKDKAWLALGGTCSAIVLFIALSLQWLLNDFWAFSGPIEVINQEKIVAVNRDSPHDLGEDVGGRTLDPDDPESFADAREDAVRQGDVLIALESVKNAGLADKNQNTFFLIHVRIANVGPETVKCQGFSADKQPALSDTSGRVYPYIETRKRLPAQGDPVFDDKATNEERNLIYQESQGYLLVFGSPSVGKRTLKLDIPASAWGRPGTIRFRLAGDY